MKNIVSETVEFIKSQNYSHIITLKPNDNPRNLLFRSIDGLHRLFREFVKKLDRRLIGAHFNRASNWARCVTGIGIFEGDRFNGHIHGMLDIQPEFFDQIPIIFPDQEARKGCPVRRLDPWRMISPGGSYDVVPLHEGPWPEYITKELYAPDLSDRLIILPARA